MRFLLRRVMTISYLPIAVALLALSFTACENKHIGRQCKLGVPDDTGAASTVTGEILACPTRICLLPAKEQPTDTSAFCTAECSSSEDCADGELRNKDDKDDKRCKSGFVCDIATVIGDFCCKKLCICQDFKLMSLSDTPPQATPAACVPGGVSTCRNVN